MRCTDETYPPFDGLYLNYAYGRKITLSEIKNKWLKTIAFIKKRQAPSQMGIYIHWPFCVSKCTYCFCNSFVPSRGNELKNYLFLIIKELEEFSKIFKNISISSVYLGGGTPTFMADGDFRDLLLFLKERYKITDDTQIYAEGSPHTLTESKIRIMAECGVNRLTIGAQSLDERVLRKINRVQTKKEFEKSYSLARKTGKFKINVDLIAGLEGQSAKSFLKDLDFVIKNRPDMIHVYSFDPRPHTIFSQKGKIMSDEKKSERDLMCELAEKILNKKGFLSVKLANFDLDSSHTEDRQDTHWKKYNASVLGIGYNAVSHAFASVWYQHPPIGDKIKRLDYDSFPPFFGINSNEDEEMRKFAIHRLNEGFTRKEFSDLFKKDISVAKKIYSRLKDLEKSGKVKISKNYISSFIESYEEYLVLSKHLYSENVIKNIMKTRQKEYEKFLSLENNSDIDECLKSVLGNTYKSMSFYKFKQ
ncbi:hypothetical protein A3C24_04055 [Candidatus Roizmanbacteria bacterium RIFCSPHIGHO2_02_FULL_37_24]|uniref:Radical SAM core domain-containing protein n=1 Tax=Candidatus Roizmanbacteria bacterium RIFCSPHIGHO2_02_FULL_37_24 TaxID=1802037 RepID=A0A1F7GW78_9BACT|nr:MAG: hypothetical protein A3C24_04055 [Candidatus Roizmanbacteria bacterium RIFCSPHIGHO2_02_FULL_37_24]